MALATSTLASTSPARTPQFSFFVALQDVVQDYPKKKVTSLENGFSERFRALRDFQNLALNKYKKEYVGRNAA